MSSDGATPTVSAKSFTGISGRLGVPTWLSTSFGGASLGRFCLSRSTIALVVAQARQIRRRHDHDFVGREQRLLHPRRPQMRHVHDHARRDLAHGIEHGFIGAGLGIVDAIQHRRRREQRKMLARFQQQAVEQHIVEALRRGQRIGDALARFLVEIQTRRAERQIEIDDGGVDLAGARRCDQPTLCASVEEPTPPRAPTKLTTRPDGRGFRTRDRVPKSLRSDAAG